MTVPVNNISRLIPGLIESGKPAESKPTERLSGGSFADQLSGVINSVNDLQTAAGEAQQAFLSGEPVELHEVMIKAEEAGLAMDLLLEIRNRLLEGYQEIMRMPV